MDNLKHPGPASNPASAQDGDPAELVCSPEFAQGCADPSEGTSPDLKPDAPIPAVQSRPQGPGVRAEAVEPAPVLTHNTAEKPEAGFPEVACSAEFPDGCIRQSGKD